MTNRVMPTDSRSMPRDNDLYLKIVREVLHQDQMAGPLRLPVVSDSMRPLLRAGDWIFVEAVTSPALGLGDIIVVQRGAELITHRLVAQDEQGWRTHGDNTRVLDPVVLIEEIVGRVSAIERGTHRIDLRARRWQTTNRWIGRIDRAKLRVLNVGWATPFRSARRFSALAAWPFQTMLRLVVAVELKLSRRKDVREVKVE
jgi:signal peptidase I